MVAIPEREVATLAGGCFWCLEAIFQSLKGVMAVKSGYTGGHVVNPTYEQVCDDTTGHAEAVQITFDPTVISFSDLLDIFFNIHDPTTLNRQGADVGSQYRSGVFYHSDLQQEIALAAIKELERKNVFSKPIVTEVTAITRFYPSEDYHDDYFRRNPKQPYCDLVVGPKVKAFQRKYADKLVDEA